MQSSVVDRWQSQLRAWLNGPRLAAIMPAIVLLAYWLGGEPALIFLAIGGPALLVTLSLLNSANPTGTRDPVTGLALRDDAVATANAFIRAQDDTGSSTAAIVVGMNDFDELCDRAGELDANTVLTRCGERIAALLRNDDCLVRLDGARFACILAPGPWSDIEPLVEISSRILSALEEPFMAGGTRILVAGSVGFCTWPSAPEASGEGLLAAAEEALTVARSHGNGTIRGYTPDLQKAATEGFDLAEDLAKAIENDQVTPWFQPQVSAESGEISGVEVLVRWTHPERGVIPPAEFLSAARQLGLIERLGEKVLHQGLEALQAWDSVGLTIPSISVNMSLDELSNPFLIDRVRWELDGFGIEPSRLVVEVPEAGAAQARNEVVVRNLHAFTKLGCGIDLDDFGTGHASLESIERFSVNRLKVDRSFVTQIDADPEQQKVVETILATAAHLGAEALAQGVETPEERALLKKLGCDHLQGFGIARPMPFEKLESWANDYCHGLGEERPPTTGDTAFEPTVTGKTA